MTRDPIVPTIVGVVDMTTPERKTQELIDDKDTTPMITDTEGLMSVEIPSNNALDPRNLDKDIDKSIAGDEPKETTETTDDLAAENPQEAPTLQQMKKMRTDVLDITQRIENLDPVLDLQSIKEEVKQLKNKMETWEAQMVALNKFHMQVLHNSTLTLSLLRKCYPDTKEDK